jgi:ABC-type multidrug transport system permease subunit
MLYLLDSHDHHFDWSGLFSTLIALGIMAALVGVVYLVETRVDKPKKD